MGEKYYKPIINDGDHLVKSKKNEGRVRGISQNSENKTTDIVEWEEVEVETQNDYYEPQPVELTPEQQMLAEAIGVAISALVIYGAEKINEHVIKPWWNRSAKPWIKARITNVKDLFSGETKITKIIDANKQTTNVINIPSDTQIDELLDKEFDSIQFDMSSDEARQHVMRLIYHMLGMAYEIKILSNTRIMEQVEDDSIRIEKQRQAEKLLAEKVAININEFLSNDELLLDVSISKQLFALFGGGIRSNDEYIPVEIDKVCEAIDSMNNNRRS